MVLMFDFAFVDLCLNWLYHMRRFRFGPVIFQIGTNNKPTTTTKTSTNLKVYSETCQASKMERFAKTIKNFI